MGLLKRVPLAVSALALGAAGLGNLLMPYSPIARAVLGVVSAVLVVLVVLRAAVDFADVRDELRTPPALAVFPTLFMALMLLATYLKPFSAAGARTLWIAALVAQFAVVALFVSRFVVRFDLSKVLPSWFLVFVGFVIASVTSPAFGMEALGRILLLAGLAGYVVMLPVVVTRLRRGPLPAPALPTLAIVAAPPSLCLVGYLSVTAEKSPAVVYTLLVVALVSFGFVLISLPKILRAPFSPAFAALTFPTVITATAVKQSMAFLASAGVLTLPWAVQVMDVLASAVVVYVLARYVALIVVPSRPAEAEVAPATA